MISTKNIPILTEVIAEVTMILVFNDGYQRHSQYHNSQQLYYIVFLLFFYLSFTVLSRIFHLYRADRSSMVGENRRTRGKTT